MYGTLKVGWGEFWNDVTGKLNFRFLNSFWWIFQNLIEVLKFQIVMEVEKIVKFQIMFQKLRMIPFSFYDFLK